LATGRALRIQPPVVDPAVINDAWLIEDVASGATSVPVSPVDDADHATPFQKGIFRDMLTNFAVAPVGIDQPEIDAFVDANSFDILCNSGA
jgi:hypothetical protein